MGKLKKDGAQFTYDFGITIAQSTVSKITKLTGATLTLASAFYALKANATEYVDTLRKNTLQFGGVLSTMKAMEQAQNRLIKGQSYFGVKDQLEGMNKLMQVGVKVGENFDWINKAAHATGNSYAEFSNKIASAIGGNMQSLVDMGLLTQRASRMFDKYTANTVQRQQAILNFVKNHKGLMNAIKNDFETIQDQAKRLKGIWNGFLRSILGKPNDPSSFYGQIVASMKMVATALARNMEQIKRYGFIIGQVLGWVIRQVGHFVVWLGKQAKGAIDTVWKVTDDFKNQARSIVVWLEFWKLKVLDFFRAYGDEIKTIIKWMLVFKALKGVFVISKAAIASAAAYNAALFGRFGLFTRMKRIRRMVGTSWWKSFWAAVLPRRVTKVATKLTRFFNIGLPKAGKKASGLFRAIGGYLGKNIFGSVLKIAGKFTSVVGVLWTVWEVLDKVGEKVKWIGDWTNGVKDGVARLKNAWLSLTDEIRFWWQDFSKGFSSKWKKYVSGPISETWKKHGMPEYFDNMKKKANEAMTAINKAMRTLLIGPFEQTFGWVRKLVEKGKSNYIRSKELEEAAKAEKERQQFWSDINHINKKRAEARRRGLPEANYQYPRKYTEDLATMGAISPNATIPVADWSNPTQFGGVPLKTIVDSGSPAMPSVVPENPIIKEESKVAPASSSSADEDYDSFGGSDIHISSGGIQIIVQKGENIDEYTLAKKIREVLGDIERDNNVRGGSL